MDNIKIEQLYETIIKGITLNYDNLKIFFNDNEINELINNNIIYLVDNEYKLTSTEGFYKYGTKLVVIRRTRDAYMCFKKCVDIDNNRRAYLELVFFAVKRRDYENAIELLGKLYNIDYISNKDMNDLYLYLINQLLLEPKETFININIMKSSKTASKEFNIRQAILNYKYSYAIKQLNEIISENDYAYNVELSLLKELLSQLAIEERNFKFTLLTHARKKEHKEIIKLLEQKSQNRYLKNREAYVYLIAKAIIEIKETKIIPTATVFEYKTNQIYEAIKGNNFKLALELDTNFNNRINSNNDNSIINILLIEINKLISFLEVEEQMKKSMDILEQQNDIKPKTLSRHKSRTE